MLSIIIIPPHLTLQTSYLSSKFLQSSNVDSTFFRRLQVPPFDRKATNRANHTTGLSCVTPYQSHSPKNAYLRSKLLQPSDVDSTLFGGLEVAPSNTEVTGWANHTTCQTQRIVWKYCFRCTIVILKQKKNNCFNRINFELDIQFKHKHTPHHTQIIIHNLT